MIEIQENTKAITVSDSFAFAMDVLVKNVWILLPVQLTISLVPQILTFWIPDKSVAGVIALLLQLPLLGGYMGIYLALIDGESPRYSDLFSKTSMFWRFLLLTLCLYIIIGLGFIFLIVPGIIAAVHLLFCCLCVVNEDMGPIEAIKRSSELTAGYRWQLFGIFMALFGVAIMFFVVGGIFFGVPAAIFAGVMHVEAKQLQPLIMVIVPCVVLPIVCFMQLVQTYCYRAVCPLSADQ